MKSIKSNFIWNTILKVSALIFPLIIYPYVSRTVGVEGVGRVSFAISVIAYFSIIAQLGIPTYGIRAIAQNAENKNDLSRTAQEILRINIVTTLVSYGILIVAIQVVPRFQEDRTLLLITSLEMIFNAVGMVWLFSGLEQYSYITIRSIVFKVISLILIFAFVHKPDDYIFYAGITVFSVVGSNVLNLFYSRKFISFRRFEKYDYKKHLKPITVFFLLSVANTVYTSLDTIMLGFMASNTAVGLYTSATKVRSVLLGIVNALAIVMLPRSAYYIKNGMRDEFIKISQKAFHFILIIAAATWLYFSIYARECILLLSGKEFADATYPMLWIMPTILICGVSNLTSIQMLVSMGKEKQVLISQIAGAIIDFVLNAIFIPKYGPSAAAGATMIAEFVILIMQLRVLHADGIRLWGDIKLYKIAVPLLASCFACYWVKHITSSNIIRLVGSAIVFAAIYGGLLFLFKEPIFIETCRDGIGMVKKRLKR